MTYGVRGYGTRTYGDASLGAAAAVGGGGGTPHVETLAAPATITFTAQTPSMSFAYRRIPAPATLTFTAQTPKLIRTARPSPASVLLTAQTPTVMSIPAGGVSGGYEVWSVNRFGARYGNVKATVEAIEWANNEPETVQFEFGTLQAGGSNVQALEREVQVWRHGRLLVWCVPVRPDANANRVRFRARGLGWYFDRRHFGKPDRENFLDNPQFEDGLTGWTVENTTPTIQSGQKNLGEQAVRLEQITAQQDAYLSQTLTVTGTGVGTLWTLVGWYMIDPAEWEGEALGARGLTLSRIQGSTIVESGVHEISGSTPRGIWLRSDEVTVWTPPDVTEDLQVRLYSPAKVIYWDALSLTIMESLSSVSSGYPDYDWTSDMATMMGSIVVHAQDAAYQKDDLNIGTYCPPTGRRIERHYQFAEHFSIGDALREYPKEGGPDFAVETTPTTRTFRTYSPRRGVDRPNLRLYLVNRGEGAHGNIVETGDDGFAWSFDGEQAVTRWTTLGNGDGPDREEGGAVDLGAFGGLALERVESAPPGASIDSLDRLAAEGLATFTNPVLLEVSFREPAWIGILLPGDRVPVLIDYGYVQVNATYRVVKLRLRCKDDVMRATLNVEA